MHSRMGGGQPWRVAMIISDSAVFQAAHHQHIEKREVRESLQLWVDRPVGQLTGGGTASGDQVTLSEQSRTAPVAEIESDESMLQWDFRLEVLRRLNERLTGRKIAMVTKFSWICPFHAASDRITWSGKVGSFMMARKPGRMRSVLLFEPSISVNLVAPWSANNSSRLAFPSSKISM